MEISLNQLCTMIKNLLQNSDKRISFQKKKEKKNTNTSTVIMANCAVRKSIILTLILNDPY